ncbi:MAG: prephenate dehydrogenase dimerization domain-containing protein, partial [Candidatus Dormibacterales bacterium]
PWALTRPDPRVEWMVRVAGARPLIIDAESHDRLVAGVSHAAFLLSAAYVLALAGRPDWGAMSDLAGPGYRDLSRLAEGDPEMYLGVAQTNRAHMLAAIDSVRGEIDRLRAHLESGDERLGELLEEARSVRARWRREREVAGGG